MIFLETLWLSWKHPHLGTSQSIWFFWNIPVGHIHILYGFLGNIPVLYGFLGNIFVENTPILYDFHRNIPVLYSFLGNISLRTSPFYLIIMGISSTRLIIPMASAESSFSPRSVGDRISYNPCDLNGIKFISPIGARSNFLLSQRPQRDLIFFFGRHRIEFLIIPAASSSFSLLGQYRIELIIFMASPGSSLSPWSDIH